MSFFLNAKDHILIDTSNCYNGCVIRKQSKGMDDFCDCEIDTYRYKNKTLWVIYIS